MIETGHQGRGACAFISRAVPALLRPPRGEPPKKQHRSAPTSPSHPPSSPFRHPPHQAGGERVRQATAAHRRAAQAHHRAGGGGRRSGRGHSPQPGRHEGPQRPHRQLPVPGANRWGGKRAVHSAGQHRLTSSSKPASPDAWQRFCSKLPTPLRLRCGQDGAVLPALLQPYLK